MPNRRSYCSQCGNAFKAGSLHRWDDELLCDHCYAPLSPEVKANGGPIYIPEKHAPHMPYVRRGHQGPMLFRCVNCAAGYSWDVYECEYCGHYVEDCFGIDETMYEQRLDR